MKVLLRQSISLYGADYGVGLREIPDGHACGEAWDIYVKAGWIVPQGKPVEKPAEPEAAAEAVAVEVADDADSETVDIEAEPEAAAEKHSRKKK